MRARNTIHRAIATFLIFLAPGLLASGELSPYQQSVEQWRKDYEATLNSDDGWLTVAGLFWLHEGKNPFGSDPLNDIVLPAGSVPAVAGYFDFRQGKTWVHVNHGVPITLQGKPIEFAELLPDSTSDRLKVGTLTLYLHASGDRYAIRLKDKNSKIRRDFKGLRWFPIDESYRVVATFVLYNPPKRIRMQTVMGDTDIVPIVGYVTFTVGGQDCRLDAQAGESGALSFVFRDLTSGDETYPSARFLDTDAPKSGKVVLDFNEAYNPPCAYNPYTTCPVPPPGDRLRVKIQAGEKMYEADDGPRQ
jgi:uncharacterized protein (DUF1684 family)